MEGRPLCRTQAQVELAAVRGRRCVATRGCFHDGSKRTGWRKEWSNGAEGRPYQSEREKLRKKACADYTVWAQPSLEPSVNFLLASPVPSLPSCATITIHHPHCIVEPIGLKVMGVMYLDFQMRVC